MVTEAETRRARRTRRTRSRSRGIHAILLVGVGGVIAAIVLESFGDAGPGTQRASLATGYASLAALLVSIALGPLRVLRSRPNPVSSDLRRDVGIFAMITGVAHVVLALQHHFAGAIRLYFFVDGRIRWESARWDSFGWGVWVGTLATLILIVLGALSNDRSLRGLGRRRWKAVQRANYALVALAVAHTIFFWAALKRDATTETAVILTAIVVLILQAGGFVIFRKRRNVAFSRH